MGIEKPSWVCCQIGAREHYAVARALHQQGMLAGLITDWYAFWGGAKRQTKSGQQKIERRNERAGSREKETSNIQHPTSNIQKLGSRLFGGRGRSALAARSEAIPNELFGGFPFPSLLGKWRLLRLEPQGRSHEGYLLTDSAFAAA